MTDVIMIRDLGIKIKVNLPNFNGDMEEYEATWMRNIYKEIYEMAFGLTSWLVYIKDECITPLSCAMYFTDSESKRVKLGEMLNMNKTEIFEDIYKRRANEFYARQE
jgi:hypothetical protein